MPYEPAVPETVSVFEITDEEHDSVIKHKTHFFDLTSNTVEAYPQSQIDAEEAKKQQLLVNAEKREFLNSTDWMVLRHMRETALNQPTTLSNEEYISLEQERADAAAAIVQIQ